MRVLWVGDAGVSTGFARCTHAACDALYDAGHEVVILGVNFYGDPPQHEAHPYEIWPAVNLTDGGRDMFGEGRLARMVNRTQPDVIVLLTDPWNVPAYLNRLKAAVPDQEADWIYQVPPVVGWLAVDSCNQAGSGCNDLERAIAWTEFGAKELAMGGCDTEISVVPLGVDLDEFSPGDKVESRARCKTLPEDLPADAYLVGAIARNQPRKRLDLTVRAFCEWTDRYQIEDAYLVLHVAPTGESGVDLRRVCSFYGTQGRVILVKPHVGIGVKAEHMPDFYRSLDVLLSTSAGEGWGLPVIEAMACGVPCIAPNWSGLGSWAKGAAYLVPCTQHEVLAPQNDMRYTIGAVPDLEETVEALQHFYHSEDAQRTWGHAGIERAHQFTWHRSGEMMVEQLEDVVRKRVMLEEAVHG